MSFEPITSQEKLDEIIKENLDREKKKYDGYLSKDDVVKMKTEYEDKLKAFEGYTSPEELAKKEKELTTQISALQSENKNLKLNELKDKVSHEFKLPYEIKDRLRGSTEEELRSDAEALSKVFGSAAKNPLPLASSETGDSGDNGMMTKNEKIKLLRNLKGED